MVARGHGLEIGLELLEALHLEADMVQRGPFDAAAFVVGDLPWGDDHGDRPVALLVGLQQRGDRAWQRQGAAVEGVDEARPLPGGGAEADVGSPRLEVGEDAARRHFEVALQTRRPGLEVVLLPLGEAHVGGAHQDHPVVETELLQNRLRVAHQALELVERALGSDELDQLDLVELVETEIAAGVLPGGACLAAPAGGEGDVADGQQLAVEDLLPIEVGHRDLSGGDEEHVALGVEGVVLELGQLGRSHHHLPPDQVWRGDLGIAVPGCGQIEHERGEGALETRPGATDHGEAAAGDPGGALEVEDAEALTQLVVG